MGTAVEGVRAVVPALLFLCAGVPLAALLDRLGFFDAVAVAMARRWERIPVGALWLLAAATTAVLNLDTTVVLLTPLYLRLARRAGEDPLPLATVPLLLAAFASSVLPGSNLTTLVAADRFDLTAVDVLVHLGPVSAAAVGVGWLAYRRRHPTTLIADRGPALDRRALATGAVVVAVLLAGFALGPPFGVAPWMVAVAADVVLVVVTRLVPWRDVPVLTAVGVAVLAAAVAVVVPAEALTAPLGTTSPPALGGLTLVGAAAANVVNNLPALLVALDGSTAMTPGTWAWLAGVNTGSVLLPLGALANLLWRRIARDEGLVVGFRGYLAAVVPVAVPALAAATLTVVVTSRWW